MKTIALALLSFFVFAMPCFAARPEFEQQQADVVKLPTCFATLERLGVTVLRTGSLDLFTYSRGSFTKSKARHPDGSNPKPFDAQATADLLDVQKAFAATGVSLEGVRDVRYDTKGALIFAEFDLPSLFSRFRYAYSPRYKALPADRPRELEHTKIDANWYFIWEDWN